MKVLVATRETQGDRQSDVMTAIEGELVFMIDPCGESRRQPDGACPCGITFVGMTSDEITTTAVVRELELTRSHFVQCLQNAVLDRRETGCTCQFDVSALASELLDLARCFPNETIIERRVDEIRVRRSARIGW
ncbi:DUF7715 family protein [Agromyces atrinae]|uniref:DUF7715 domain-containing protein n=1 Tax=Agromyces atrinae TaxID=592376 RepID=A0A852S9S3_9MICO|nr:hypothetical protein [Agromyces atrinae]NYD65564.1 hypothetical protein [Agromyces atrinae]